MTLSTKNSPLVESPKLSTEALMGMSHAERSKLIGQALVDNLNRRVLEEARQTANEALQAPQTQQR